MLTSLKTKRTLDDHMDKTFFGMIRISSAFENINEHMLPTLDREQHEAFKNGCKEYFKEKFRVEISIYSSGTKLKTKVDMLSGELPEDWEDHLIKIEDYNYLIRGLNLDKKVPQIKAPIEEHREKENDPYSFSSLEEWLEHDTWSNNDALLIIIGIEPTGADVNWDGFENVNGIHVNIAKLVNASFFDDIYDSYIDPHYISEDELKEWGYTDIETIDQLAQRREKILAYSSKLGKVKSLWDASDFDKERYSPKHYIDWAARKKIHVPWLDWATNKNIFESSSIGDGERDTLLKIIGALATTIAEDHKPGFWIGGRQNVSAITEHVHKALAQDVYGLKKANLNSKIGEGLKLIDQAKNMS